MPPDPLPPRYADVRLLGAGSFAVVFAARDLLLERPVAVKLLREDRACETTSRLRFAREARIAALLGTHPHVVTVHDTGEWDGRPYLVLELLEGSVAERLRGPVAEGLALRWLAQAAAALDFVHASGVVHRDVTPTNLLLDARGDLRLSDFGVAYGGTRDAALTAEGAVVGTPGYLAPEVAAGGVATPASDRYGLAVVAGELLGDRPALARGLARAPEERYASAAELVAALGVSTEPTHIRLPPLWRIERIPRTQVGPAAVRPAARRRAVRRGVRLLGVAALVAVAAAGGAVAAGRFVHHAATRAPLRAAAQQICAVSTFRHDANVVVAGVGAARFCRAQTHVLSLQGNEWTYRAGGQLLAPDHGAGSVSVVCALARRGFRLTVYDSGGRSIGRDLCTWYGGAGWRPRTT